jgi:hypothetical protein
MIQKLKLIWRQTQIMLQDLQDLKESLLFVLNRFFILLTSLLFFSSSYIANYNTTVNEAWQRWEFLMYFNFTLMFFALRKEVIMLISKTGYKIVLYLFINYFMIIF